jgi:hypothetical protein
MVAPKTMMVGKNAAIAEYVFNFLRELPAFSIIAGGQGAMSLSNHIVAVLLLIRQGKKG